MRPEGFYFVTFRNDPEWVVAEWTGRCWLLPGLADEFNDNDFNRITAPITPPWTGYEPQE